MSTTLHLLLGDKYPHEMPPHSIARNHMISLHIALLNWLLTGSLPPLWGGGSFRDDINPPCTAELGPHLPHSTASTITLPQGHLWHPRRASSPAPPPRALPLSSASTRKKAKLTHTGAQPFGTHPPQQVEPPKKPPQDSTQSSPKRRDTTPPTLRTSNSVYLGPALPSDLLIERTAMTQRRATTHRKTNTSLHQSMMTDH